MQNLDKLNVQCEYSETYNIAVAKGGRRDVLSYVPYLAKVGEVVHKLRIGLYGSLL